MRYLNLKRKIERAWTKLFGQENILSKDQIKRLLALRSSEKFKELYSFPTITLYDSDWIAPNLQPDTDYTNLAHYREFKYTFDKIPLDWIPFVKFIIIPDKLLYEEDNWAYLETCAIWSIEEVYEEDSPFVKATLRCGFLESDITADYLVKFRLELQNPYQFK